MDTRIKRVFAHNLSDCPKPEFSDVNFAVPDLSILRNFYPYGVQGERKPDIYDDIMSPPNDNLCQKSACPTFDGRKISKAYLRTRAMLIYLDFKLTRP